MNLLVLLTTFAVILPAELPDKSLFAALVLGTRMRPLGVWLGTAAAFTVHVVIAVAAGGVLTLLPDALVRVVVAALFATGAIVLFREARHGDEVVDEVRGEADAASGGRPPTLRRSAAAAFGLVFLGEWGDVTQIATANLAAHYADPVAVGIGATLALWTAGALAVTLGQRLVKRVPASLLQRAAGTIMAVLAVTAAVDVARG